MSPSIAPCPPTLPFRAPLLLCGPCAGESHQHQALSTHCLHNSPANLKATHVWEFGPPLCCQRRAFPSLLCSKTTKKYLPLWRGSSTLPITPPRGTPSHSVTEVPPPYPIREFVQQSVADNLFLLLKKDAQQSSPASRQQSYRRAPDIADRSRQRTEAAPPRLPSPSERSRCRTQPPLLTLTLIQCLANYSFPTTAQARVGSSRCLVSDMPRLLCPLWLPVPLPPAQGIHHWLQQLGPCRPPKWAKGRKSFNPPSSCPGLASGLSTLPTSSCLPNRQPRWEQRADHGQAVGTHVLRDETTLQQDMNKAKPTEARTHTMGLCVLPCTRGCVKTCSLAKGFRQE